MTKSKDGNIKKLEDYLKEINQFHLLKHEDEIILAKKFKKVMTIMLKIN